MAWILWSAACTPAAIEVGKGTSYVDSASDSDSATDSGNESGDSGVTGDSGDSGTSAPDLSAFTGTAHFVYNGMISCDETVQDQGTELAIGDPLQVSLAANCTTCNHFYTVVASQSTACTIIPVGQTYRAVFLSGMAAAIYVYTDDGRGGTYEVASTTNGAFDGTTLTWSYALDMGMGVTVDVDEVATFGTP
jgi:hypothetical protein